MVLTEALACFLKLDFKDGSVRLQAASKARSVLYGFLQRGEGDTKEKDVKL